MAEQWLRLDADFNQSPAVVRGGWEVALCWPLLLCRLKRQGGALSDADLDPAMFAAVERVPLDVAERGLARIRESSMLVQGSCVYKTGRGAEREHAGWVAPGWCRKGNGPTREAFMRFPNDTYRKESKGNDSKGNPSRGRAVPSRLSDGPELIINKREPLKRAQQKPKRRWTLATLWHKLGPRHGSSARDATGQPTGIQGDRLLTILDACTDEAIETALAASASKTAPLPYFCACFEDDGTPKPKRGAPKNPAVETMRLNEDAEDCAIAMEGNHKQCTPENVVYWLGKHGKEWEPGSFKDRVQHFLTIRGVAS